MTMKLTKVDVSQGKGIRLPINALINLLVLGDRKIHFMYADTSANSLRNFSDSIQPGDIIAYQDESTGIILIKKADSEIELKNSNTYTSIINNLPDYSIPSELSSLADSLSKLYQIVVGSDSIKEHDSGTTYNTGDVVFRYEDGQIKVYICKADGTMGEFDPSRWDEFNLVSYINQNITSSTGEIEDKLKEIYKIIYGTETSDVSEFNTSSGYSTGALVSHEGKIYMANTNVTAGEWNSEQWDEYNILDDLSALEETIRTQVTEGLKTTTDKIYDALFGELEGSLTYVPKTQYNNQDFVYKDGNWYMCKSQNSSQDWVEEEWSEASIWDLIKSDGTSILDLSKLIGLNHDKVTDVAIPNFASTGESYTAGDFVYDENKNVYICTSNITMTGQASSPSDLPDNFKKYTILDAISENLKKIELLGDSVNKLYRGLFGKPESDVDYNEGSTYNKNSVVYHDGKLYSAKEDGITGPWDETKWSALSIVDYVQTIVSAGTGEIIDDVSEMKTDISDLQSNMSRVKSDLSNLTTRVDQAEKDITALESTTADHDSRIEALETSNTSLDNRLDTAESDITQIKSTNTQQSEDIEQLKTDVGLLQTDNGTNKTNIGNLQDNFNSLNEKVSTLESDNTTNKSDISTLKTNVSSLQSDNTQNKQDITDIKQDITEINETMSILGGNQIIVSETHPVITGLKEGDLWIKPYPQQTIMFNTLGGTPEVSIMSVDYGTLATPPSNPPQVEGYEFAYWAPAVEKYTVHFNVNGGSPSIPDQTVRIDWYPRKPPTPTKSGTSFIAWTYETTEQQAVLDYMTATYNDDISNVTAESLESDYYNSYLNEYAGEHPELTGQVTAEAINAANERLAATPSTMSATNTLDNITNTDIRAEDTYKAAIKVYTENDPKFVQLDMLKREFEKRKNLEEYKKKKAEEEAAKQAEENKQETTESGDPIIDAEIVSESHTSVSTNNNTESDNTQK